MSQTTNAFTKFGRLTLPSKIGILGGLASIIALGWLIADKYSAANPSTPPKPEHVSNVRQDNVGGDAIVNTGEHSTIHVVKGASSSSARNELQREIIKNIRTADEHLGGIHAMFSTCSLWPSQEVAKVLEQSQSFLRARPFTTDSFAAAKTHSELTDADGWEHVVGFYSHMTDGVVRNRSELTETCQQLLNQGVDKKALTECLTMWINSTEGNYHVLNIAGQVALESIGIADDLLQTTVTQLKYLPLAAGQKTGVSEMLEKRLKTMSPFQLVDSLTKIDVIEKLKHLATEDFDGHAALAMRARNIGFPEEAKIVFEKLADRMASNMRVVKYAEIGIRQIDDPSTYSSLRGLFVAGFVEGDSAGRSAGLTLGDVLISYDGIPLDDAEDLDRAKRITRSNMIDLVVIRRGERLSLRCKSGPLGTEIWGY